MYWNVTLTLMLVSRCIFFPYLLPSLHLVSNLLSFHLKDFLCTHQIHPEGDKKFILSVHQLISFKPTLHEHWEKPNVRMNTLHPLTRKKKIQTKAIKLVNIKFSKEGPIFYYRLKQNYHRFGYIANIACLKWLFEINWDSYFFYLWSYLETQVHRLLYCILLWLRWSGRTGCKKSHFNSLPFGHAVS